MIELLSVLDLGWPQLAAILVLIQRGLEEAHSRRNTKRLLDSGATEYGAEYYPVVAAAHIGWIAAIFLLVPADSPIYLLALIPYLILQLFRYWIIFSLGKYWTHRIITLASAPVISTGPYRYMRHPNYFVTYLETVLLPLCFGAIGIALIFGPLWWTVIRYKIVLEDRALEARRRS